MDTSKKTMESTLIDNLSIRLSKPISTLVAVLFITGALWYANTGKTSYQAVVIPTPILTPTPYPRQYFTEEERQKLYQLINGHRLDNGLKPLTVNEKLELSALGKVNDMITYSYWDHISPYDSKKDPWYWFGLAGVEWLAAGENLAEDFDDPYILIDAWKKSPSHNETLLYPSYNDVGLGVLCHAIYMGRPNVCIFALHLTD